MSDARKITLVILALMSVQFVAACAMFESKEKKSLPPDRSANVLVFPVEGLEFRNLVCAQEFEKMTLSGQVKNVSSSPIANVRVRAVILFTGDFPGDYTSDTFNLAVNPLVLQPSQWGSFTLTGTVHKTISHAELHAHWQPYTP